MAVKGGSMIHDANGFVVDRIQTAGVSSLNLPQEKIYELGNWQSVQTIRDTPDLSFDMESLDVSTEVEALLVGTDPTTVTNGQSLDFANNMPLDVISPFKSASGAFDVVGGIVVPYLTLESATYRFGVGQNATQSFTLKGDAVYYSPGAPRYEEFTLVDNTLTYNLAATAALYVEGGDNIYVLSACVKNPTTKKYRRLFFGDDYTNTSTTITTLVDWFDSGYTKLHVTYGTTGSVNYPQSVHQGSSVKPGAVRAKDIDVYVSNGAATPVYARWAGVQSFEVTRRVSLERDQEFGNAKVVEQGYDIPEVTGSVTLRSVDVAELFSKIRSIANVASNQVVGPFTSVSLGVELRINDPDTGTRLKTLYIPDARFEPPPIQGRANTKIDVTIPFSSDGGVLTVYRGSR